MTQALPAIEAFDVCYRYPDGTQALRGLNLTIKEGEKVCLAGPNGAGKSTLLSSLAGLVKAKGTLAVFGHDPAPGPSVFGLVFQDPNDQLFCPTIAEDIAFGPRNQKKPSVFVHEQTHNSLAAVGLSGFESRCAHHLSGGEKKRAALAAVLACQPKILALDEPWANLDARGAQAVTAILQAFHGTLVVASHDLRRAAAVCSRLIVLNGGAVAADGSLHGMMTDPAKMQAYGLDY